LSTFADLSGNLDDPWINQNHEVVTALAKVAMGGDVQPEPVKAGRFARLDEGDPPAETLLLDADPDQQYVVDAVRAGDSLVVSTPPGSGQTQTAINTIGALVAEGKSVLVVGDRQSSLAGLSAHLESLGLDSMLFRPGNGTTPQQLKGQ